MVPVPVPEKSTGPGTGKKSWYRHTLVPAFCCIFNLHPSHFKPSRFDQSINQNKGINTVRDESTKQMSGACRVLPVYRTHGEEDREGREARGRGEVLGAILLPLVAAADKSTAHHQRSISEIKPCEHNFSILISAQNLGAGDWIRH